MDPYKLLEQTFGGSGYDIACAMYNTPITYQLTNGIRTVTPVSFKPEFKDSLFFVHLNKKQSSREGIAKYKARSKYSDTSISEISEISTKIVSCKSLEEFEFLITSHEKIISKVIGQEPIKEGLFKNYAGAIKSLGAWGGDFILVTGNEQSQDYFRDKGFPTIAPYSDMILN